MNRRTSLLFVLGLLVCSALLLTACGGQTEALECPEQTPCPECPECAEPEVDTGPAVPFFEAWESSGHADASAEAFRHWDEDDPAVVPANCAKCHSTTGYQDFIGADGTAFGSVDAESFTPDTTVECIACHNQAALALDSVVMPSGAEITGLGAEARCMQCHQGRESGLSVAAATEGLEEDTVNEELRFLNIHYYAAAATKYGTMANGGYQYAGKTYDGFFSHVPEYDACQECHSPHTLEIELNACANCHEGVETVEDLRDIRMLSSAVDYDGDGDLEEGVYFEIEGLKQQLYAAMQAYSAGIGSEIVYDPASYPYFFDTAGESFSSWTPRLLKAAYNYQVALKDPGGYAHGGKYIIQLLVDSIEDLGTDVSALQRIDHGHFAGSEEAFRHWDEDEYVVSSRCARCHSAEGLPQFLELGLNTDQPASNGFLCETCHGGGDWPARYQVSSVTFPSGTTISADQPEDQFLCMQCHQGRESGQSVDEAVAEAEADLTEALAAYAEAGDAEAQEPTLQDFLGFVNVHYFAAGATRYGSEVNGMYQFEGQEYAGYFEHVDGFAACTDCHNAHELEVKVDACAACHGTDDLAVIRMREDDFDGDGDLAEGLAGEVAGLADLLFAQMQAYTEADETLTGIVYDGHNYPYFFDTEGGRFTSWTPALLRAAYNFQYAQKDPGAFAHNGTYVIQVLIDSIDALGGDVTSLTRP
ncbi:MAG: hypothetical protein JW757_12350 [Anaerolineales bacterium]|nr:hypothetical protein [Anaerolineales bacterium]